MAFTNQIVDAGQIPISQIWTPSVGWAAWQASVIRTTDASGTIAPATFHHASGTVYLLASAAQTAATFTSSSFVVGPYTELSVGINITAKTGTTPTIQFFIDTIGADSIAYNVWASAVVNNTSPTQVIASIGSGFSTNQSFGANAQFRWAIGGSASPGYSFSVSIIGK